MQKHATCLLSVSNFTENVMLLTTTTKCFCEFSISINLIINFHASIVSACHCVKCMLVWFDLYEYAFLATSILVILLRKNIPLFSQMCIIYMLSRHIYIWLFKNKLQTGILISNCKCLHSSWCLLEVLLDFDYHAILPLDIVTMHAGIHYL